MSFFNLCRFPLRCHVCILPIWPIMDDHRCRLKMTLRLHISEPVGQASAGRWEWSCISMLTDRNCQLSSPFLLGSLCLCSSSIVNLIDHFFSYVHFYYTFSLSSYRSLLLLPFKRKPHYPEFRTLSLFRLFPKILFLSSTTHNWFNLTPFWFFVS